MSGCCEIFSHSRTLFSEGGGVKGWLGALDMSRVDVESDAFKSWVFDSTSRIAWFRNNIDLQNVGVNLTHFENAQVIIYFDLNF